MQSSQTVRPLDEQKPPLSVKSESPQVDAARQSSCSYKATKILKAIYGSCTNKGQIKYSCSEKASLVLKAVLGAGTGIGIAYKLTTNPISFGISAACGGLTSMAYRVTTTFDEYKRKATSKISRTKHADILQESSGITADSIKLVIDGKANVKEQLMRLSSPEDQARIIAKASYMREIHREKAKKDRSAAHDRRVARGQVSEQEEKLRNKMEQEELAKVEAEFLGQCVEEQKQWQAKRDEIAQQIAIEILDPELQPLQPKKDTEVKQLNPSLGTKLKRQLIAKLKRQLIEEYESYKIFFNELSKTEKAKVIVSGAMPGVSDWLAAGALIAALGSGYGGVAIALGALSGYSGLRSKTKEIAEIHQDEKEEAIFFEHLMAELGNTKKLNQVLRKAEDVHKIINQKFGKQIIEQKNTLNRDSLPSASSSHAQMMSSFSDSSQRQPQTHIRGDSSASGSVVSTAPTLSLAQSSLALPGVPDEVDTAKKSSHVNTSRFHTAARGGHKGPGASKTGHGAKVKQIHMTR